MTVTLLADPDIKRIPVIDCQDPLVSLPRNGIACLTETGATGRLVRSELAGRLRLAQDALPDGLRFVVSEGYRSPEAQLEIIHRYTGFLRREHPDASEVDLHRMSSRFVSPIDVAPHVAGAAVDITLMDRSGRQLWMGTEIDATPEDSDGACYADASNIDAQARANRNLLTGALSATGLVNYPTEWWHFSFGDRYWAFTTGSRHAIYGACDR